MCKNVVYFVVFYMFISNHLPSVISICSQNASFPNELCAFKGCRSCFKYNGSEWIFKTVFYILIAHRGQTQVKHLCTCTPTSHAVNSISHFSAINLMHSAWEAFMLIGPCVPAQSLETQAPSYVFCRKTVIVNVANLWLLNLNLSSASHTPLPFFPLSEVVY